jgi:Ca2+-binding EF-hand superfamily protein
MSRSKLSRWAGLAFGIAGAWGVALPSVAFADQEATFEAMDTNGDGKISPDEHAMATGQMFEKMDANGDNRVTAAEMTAAHQKITGKKPEKGEMTAVEKIKTMDTNGDSVLTVEEYAAGSQWMFQQMDTDHDGYLTKAEVKAGHQKFMHKKAVAPSPGSTRPAD